MSYKQFTIYQDKAQSLKRLQEDLRRTILGDSPNRDYPTERLQDIHDAIWDIRKKMLNKQYGWSGEDANTFYEKLREICQAVKQIRSDLWRSEWPIEDAIEEERVRYANLAMEEMRNFSPGDWAACAWNNPEDWWNDLFS